MFCRDCFAVQYLFLASWELIYPSEIDSLGNNTPGSLHRLIKHSIRGLFCFIPWQDLEKIGKIEGSCFFKILLLTKPLEEEEDRREDKGRGCYLGDRIYLIPCHASSYFAPGRFEE